MKKLLFILVCCLTGFAQAKAENTNIDIMDNVIYIEPMTANAGSHIELSVMMKNGIEAQSFEFKLSLPEGMHFSKKTSGKPMINVNSNRVSLEDLFNLSDFMEDGTLWVIITSRYQITGNSGEVASIPIDIDTDIEQADYPITLTDIKITPYDQSTIDPIHIDQVTTTLKISGIADPRIELNEESTEEIEAATDVDVRVVRTISANQWSTICLPFAMTEAQCKEAFGDDVELADFTSYDIEQNEAKETVGITVNFADVTAIEANHPYIIKVGADISEFSVDGVTIAPDEEEAYTQYDNGVSGRGQIIYGWLVGTYHADTTVPSGCLFLSDNNFWYSAGQTKMKAFRAYFELNDKLTHPADDTQADSRLRLHIIPGETTGIAEKSSAVRLGHTATYDLQGRRVTSPRGKGLYISEGRKIIVK